MTTSPLPVFRRAPAILPTAIAALLVVGVSIYWLAGSIAQEKYRNVLIAAVLVQVGWVVMRWRMSVYAFMVFVIVEGFLVNYFYQIPELNLLKDAFIISLFGVLALQLVAHSVFPFPRTIWSLPFFAFSAVYLLQVFNPSLPNVLVGLVGVRVNLLFFLLMPVAFWFFDSRERVLHFFQFLFWVSLPVSFFGIVQYLAGPSLMTSLSPGFSRAVYYAYGLRPTQEAIYFRTFSTFVHTGGFGMYLSFMMLVSVALWMIPSLRRFRVWILGGFIVQFIALLTTGSRGAFVWFLLALGMLFLLQRGRSRLVPLMLILPLILWGSMFVVGPGFVERFGSILDLDMVQGRNIPLMYGWLTESMKTDWAGLGAGYASVASRHAGVTPLNLIVVENGLAKIRFEAGLPGFFLYVIFILSLMLDCLHAPARTQDNEVRWIVGASAAFMFVCISSVTLGTPFDASPTNTYLWFFAGLLARAGYLAKQPISQQVISPSPAPAMSLHGN